MSNDARAGWYSDPTGQHDRRYWDGQQWTDEVADGSGPPPGALSDEPTQPSIPVTAEAPPAASPPGFAPFEPAAPPPASPPAGTLPPPPAWPPSVAGTPPPPPPPGASPRRGLSGGALVALVLALIALPIIAIAAIVLLGREDDDDTADAFREALEEDGDGAINDEFLIDAMATGIRAQLPQASPEQAECVAAGMLRALGREELADLAAAGIEGRSPLDVVADIPLETQQEIAEVMLDCLPANLLEQLSGDGSPGGGVGGLPGEAN